MKLFSFQSALAFCFILFFNFLYSQNMVPNGGFETMSSCPTTDGQINLATPWFDPTGTGPDFFNQCASGASGMGVPANNNGNQAAHNGNGYSGLFTYFNNSFITNIREYMEVHLTTPLTAGVTYYVSYYVSRADVTDYATSSLCAYFSSSSSTPPSPTTGSIVPQVNNSTVITDAAGWTLVQGSFNATGGEQYLTIGNFALSANSSPTFVGPATNGIAYYYIDDIYVNDTSATSSVGMNETSEKAAITVYPNPTHGNINIVNSISKIKSIKIFNFLGDEIEELTCNSQNETSSIFDLSALPRGVYYIRFVANGQINFRKIIVI